MFKGFGKSTGKLILESAEKEAAAKDAVVEKSDPKVAAAVVPQMESNKEVAQVAKPVTTTASTKAFQNGQLSLKLIEARGLKMPEGGIQPGGATGKDVGHLPFAVIEMDKNEVIMRAVEADPATSLVTFQTKANLYS